MARISGILLIVVALLTPLRAAMGQVLPGAGGFAGAVGGARGESHAWVALPVSGLGENAGIVHLPPRIAVGESDRHADAADGAVRLAVSLPEMPERLAAFENTLYMAFGPESAGRGKLQRRVLTIEARRGPIGGSWVAESEGQRLTTLPSLPGESRLAGFVGTARGPIALLASVAGEGSESYSLRLLSGREWKELPLPREVLAARVRWPRSRVEVLATPSGPAVCLIEAERVEVWTSRSWAAAGAEAEWDRTELSLQGPGGAALRPASPLMVVGGQYVYAARAPGRAALEVWNPTPDGCYRLATLEGVGSPFAVAPLDQVGRVAVLWQEPEVEEGPPPSSAPARPGPPRAPRVKTMIAEVSVVGGEVLYQGPAKVGGPVSSQELRLLAMALVGVMVVVLFLVLRPPPVMGPPLSLPRGVVLAEPGVRMVAGLVDFLLAAAVASLVTGTPIWQLVSLSSLMRDDGSLAGLLILIGFGFVHGTLGEWLFGRTIGKAVAGCRVARPAVVKEGPEGELRPAVAKLNLRAAFIRNVVKWTLPPLAMAGISSPERRHRGDLAAGTVVVVLAEPEAEQGGE